LIDKVTTKREPNYPKYYYTARWRGTGRFILLLLVFCGLAVLFGYVLWLGIGGILQWVGFVGVMAVILLLIRGAVQEAKDVRIITYYECPVPEARTFSSGHALARNCQVLDSLAERSRVRSLSAFGFSDPLHGEPVVWHDAAEGLKTIDALLSAVLTSPAEIDNAADVLDDLRRIKSALEHALSHSSRFALLLEIGAGSSGFVWEKRKGFP
jgi:hypothetical protein